MSEIAYVPYEYLSEHLANEATARILARHDVEDPTKIVSLLPGILQAAIHEGIDTGLGLAEFHEGDLVGPAELLAAYKLGAEEAKQTERKNNGYSS